jgi:hypothetical protein
MEELLNVPTEPNECTEAAAMQETARERKPDTTEARNPTRMLYRDAPRLTTPVPEATNRSINQSIKEQQEEKQSKQVFMNLHKRGEQIVTKS